MGYLGLGGGVLVKKKEGGERESMAVIRGEDRDFKALFDPNWETPVSLCINTLPTR